MKGSEKIQFQEKKTVLDKVSVMYDDPYEESPLIRVTLPSASASTRLHQQQVQAILQQSPLQWPFSAENKSIDNYDEKFLYAQLDTKADDLCISYVAQVEKDIEECSKKMQHITVTDSTGVNIQNIVPVSSAKFYQLSAEYGGIVDEDGDNNDNADDYDATNDGNVIGNYTDLQRECDGNLLLANNLDTGGGCHGAMMPHPLASHCIISNISGKGEEPWDLSIAQRCNKDKLQSTNPMLSRRLSRNSELVSSAEINSHRPHDAPMNQSHHILSSRQKNSYGIVRNKTQESVMQVPLDLSLSFPIYGVPWGIKSKDGKQDQDSAPRPNRGMGNYATSSFRAGSSKVNAPVPVPARSSSLRPIDSRPMEDYDEPWDQKRKVLCTAGTTNQTASFTDALSSNRTTNPTCAVWSSTIANQIDTELPLEKQQWYHACIGRLEAENILCVHREGSYLIRNSESNTKDYSLSVKSAHGFMHMKIVSNANDCFILGQFSQPFQSIAQMILHYTIHKLPIKGAEHISLIFPVPCKIS